MINQKQPKKLVPRPSSSLKVVFNNSGAPPHTRNLNYNQIYTGVKTQLRNSSHYILSLKEEGQSEANDRSVSQNTYSQIALIDLQRGKRVIG